MLAYYFDHLFQNPTNIELVSNANSEPAEEEECDGEGRQDEYGPDEGCLHVEQPEAGPRG